MVKLLSAFPEIYLSEAEWMRHAICPKLSSGEFARYSRWSVMQRSANTRRIALFLAEQLVAHTKMVLIASPYAESPHYASQVRRGYVATVLIPRPVLTENVGLCSWSFRSLRTSKSVKYSGRTFRKSFVRDVFSKILGEDAVRVETETVGTVRTHVFLMIHHAMETTPAGTLEVVLSYVQQKMRWLRRRLAELERETLDIAETCKRGDRSNVNVQA